MITLPYCCLTTETRNTQKQTKLSDRFLGMMVPSQGSWNYNLWIKTCNICKSFYTVDHSYIDHTRPV